MIQSRIALTDAQWTRLRQLALDARMPVSQFLALALLESRRTRKAFENGR